MPQKNRCPPDCSICTEEEYFWKFNCWDELFCKKEINPNHYPEVYFGVPFLFGETEGACVFICERGRRIMKELRKGVKKND